MVILVRNCQDNDETLALDGPQWGAYSNGDVITLEGYGEICWEFFSIAVGEGLEDAVVSNNYRDCEECQRTCYQLTDCTGRLLPRYTEQDFESIVGNIIKVPYYNNACFTVSVVRYSQLFTIEEIEYSNVYDDCISCRNRTTVEPNYTTGNCDTAKMLEIKGKLSETLHQEVMSARYGVKFCCLTDKSKYLIKNEILDFNLHKDPDPELPEPYVEECCIQTETPCVLPQNTCNSCNNSEEAEQEVSCNCLASANSPHDCHTYRFTITQEMLDAAIGNSNTSINNKIYFGYYPCGETQAQTARITTAGEYTYCVLGIPILGWYASNTWVNVEEGVLIRENVCEE